jgi:hypothetical protein
VKYHYAARLVRLERLAGKGACVLCRVNRRHSWRDPAEPQRAPKDPALTAVTRCEACGAPASYDLSRVPEDLRELMRLCYESSLEDTYTDPRAWAAQLWLHFRQEAEQRRREAAREMRELFAPGQSARENQQDDYARERKQRERERARAKDPDVKLYNKLSAEAQAITERKHRRLARRYGKLPFAHLLAPVEGPNYHSLYLGELYAHVVSARAVFRLGIEARAWLVCAEFERIALGRVTAHTTGRLADCELRAREVVAAGLAKYEAREEKRRSDEAERERWLEARREEARPTREELEPRPREEGLAAPAPDHDSESRMRALIKSWNPGWLGGT